MRRVVLILSLLLFMASCDQIPNSSEKCSLELPGWHLPEDGASAFRPINVIGFEGSGLVWNGELTDEHKIDDYLRLTNELNPEPHTVLDAASAPDCNTAQKMQLKIHEALKCDGLCGLGKRQEWENAPGLSGPGWIE